MKLVISLDDRVSRDTVYDNVAALVRRNHCNLKECATMRQPSEVHAIVWRFDVYTRQRQGRAMNEILPKLVSEAFPLACARPTSGRQSNPLNGGCSLKCMSLIKRFVPYDGNGLLPLFFSPT